MPLHRVVILETMETVYEVDSTREDLEQRLQRGLLPIDGLVSRGWLNRKHEITEIEGGGNTG